MAKAAKTLKKVTLQKYLEIPMKEFTLTIAERVAATKLFDEFKGNISTLAMILEDVKGFVIKEDEWAKANLVKKQNGDGTESWMWADEDSEKVVSLAKESVDYLLGKIKAKNESNEFTLADKAIVPLEAKLKA